jgi:chorismate lyase
LSTDTPIPRPARGAHWIPQDRLIRARVPVAVLSWLLEPGSLTDRLRRACGGGLRVRVVSQAWVRPHADEAFALGLRWGERALVRQVQLLCGGRPWVFARTVIPGDSLRGRHRRLARLGTRPLGAVLFADKSMRRGALELAALAPGVALYELAAACLAGRPSLLWGRRSVFRLGGRPLLVSEIFLPDVFCTVEASS